MNLKITFLYVVCAVGNGGRDYAPRDQATASLPLAGVGQLSYDLQRRETRREQLTLRNRMQRKTTVNGRPSGTDGSDFSFCMVVDSRYTKVAKGKARLSPLILLQAVIQFLGVLAVFYSASKEHKAIDNLDVSSASIYFISLIIGELGRKRSRANFLKFYMFASSIGVLLSLASVVKSIILIEVIQDLSGWESMSFELLKIGGVLAGLLVQLLCVITTVSLIGNMSPPKRAS